MSRYGFDLDGTLTVPAIRQLANDLYDAGHDVYVITGGLSDTGEWTEEARVEQIRSYGIRCTAVRRCISTDYAAIGRMKGMVCNQLGIDLFIDDAPLHLIGIDHVSNVQRLAVLPGRT